MKNTYKFALVAALGIATATGAQASDLLLGFNDAAGPASAHNDLVIDVGSLSSYTATTAFVLANGTYNAAFFNQFAATFGSDANYANHVAAGAVGGSTTPGASALVQTAPNGGLPAWTSSSSAAFLNAAGEAQSPVVGEYASAGPGAGMYGWSQVIAASPTVQGSAPGGNLAGNSVNPMATLSGGVLVEQLYESTGSGSRGFTPSSWSPLGTLTIDMNAQTITYIGTAVPEPSTYGLLAGAGLLVVALRRQVGLKKS
jgi:hypothetical protein